MSTGVYRRASRVYGVLVLFAFIAGVIAMPAQYRQPKAADYIKILEDPHRIDRLMPPEIIRKIGFKPGQVVADIGSGSGLFTRPMARAVEPSGKVYAVDIDRDLLAHVARTAADQGIRNITTVLAPEDSPSLPKGSLDVALICDTLHHIAQRQVYLQNLRECLKPDGRLVIIDFSTGWPAGHESLHFTMEELAGWIRDAGYVKVSEFEDIEGNFFHIYKLR
jgi:ubiquinone/menaquinone biosynthesis C-methylase UbiE